MKNTIMLKKNYEFKNLFSKGKFFYGKYIHMYIKKTNSKFNKIPIFIAIDQEGGRVNRMPPEILNLPSCNKIAKTNDENLVKESASLIAKILKKSGINMDFAPVLDIKRFDDNQAIGDRAFCDDKEIVAKFGIDFMKELQKE